jgi:hypothetical protein
VLQVSLTQGTYRIQGGKLDQFIELVELGHSLRIEGDLKHKK